MKIRKRKVLTFTLGEEHYGIDIMYVTEIVGIQPITVVPELPQFIKGIINLRGKIIPVMDARIKFHKEPKNIMIERVSSSLMFLTYL